MRIGCLLFLFCFLLPISMKVDGQACEDVFPDAASNSSPAGEINFGGGSSVIGSPDNVLDTTDLNDNGGPNTSCNGVSCAQSGSAVPASSYNTFPGSSNVTLGFFSSGSLPPGNYNNLTTNFLSTLYLSPGVYTFRGNISIGYLSQVQLLSPGSVTIYVRGQVVLGTYSAMNTNGANRYLFIYSRSDISLGFSADVNGVVYAGGNVGFTNDAILNGAVTAEGEINLNSASNIIFDADTITNTDFNGFCDAVPAIDHFVIDVGGGSASTCSPYEITITAEDASNNTVVDYTGTIGLTTSTSHGDWSTTGVAADALGNLTPGGQDSGSASYVFDASGADLGVIRLSLSNTHAETLTITLVDSTNAVTSVSSTVSFSENAFVVTNNDSLGNDLIAGRDHNFQIAMYRKDPSTGLCGVAAYYNVSDVKVWVTRSGSDPGGVGPQVSNADASDIETLGNSEPAGANLSLPFINGLADFSVLASDVGVYAFNFLDDTTSFSEGDIAGSSTTLIARPFGFDITVPGNPGSTNPGAAAFMAAGNDFSVNVRAVGWNAADDTNGDGIPDGHTDINAANNANLTDNATLLSFGNESPVESVVLSAVLVAPTGGNDNGLESSVANANLLSSFSSGVGSSSNVYFAEVGIIEIAASINDGNYLGAGSTFTSRISGQSSYVGRFIPADFIVSASSIEEACTLGLNYSYMGEAFTLSWQLQARNALGDLTSNYDGVFVKLDASNGALGFGAVDAVSPTPLSSRLSHNTTTFSWAAGIGTLASSVQLERDTSLDGPYVQLDIGTVATDADGVSVAASTFDLDVNNDLSDDHVSLGQTEVRFGRVRLDDAFGPETANLPVNFLTEYWNGSTWLKNKDDSCSAITLSAITYPDGPIDVSGNRTVAVGGGDATGTYTSMAGAAVNFVEGNSGHYFTAPGAGNTGVIDVDVDLSLYPWLRFDWNQDGDYSDSSLPTTNYTFGAYRGHDRIIFWQEVFN